MKTLILFGTFLIGCGIGFVFSITYISPSKLQQYSPESLRTIEAISQQYSPETLETIEAITNVIGPLSEENVQEIIELTGAYSDGTMREINLRYLWEGNASNAILDALEESRTKEAKDLAYLFLDRFREQYEEGLELGEWDVVATDLYERSANKYDEPDSDGNAEKPAGVKRGP